MTIDKNRALTAVRKYLATISPEQLRIEFEESERKLKETGIDPELRTAYLNEHDPHALFVSYVDGEVENGPYRTCLDFFATRCTGCIGNERAFRFLRERNGTRILIVMVHSVDGIAMARELLDRIRTLTGRRRVLLRCFAVVAYQNLRQALVDSGYETYPDAESLVEVIGAKIYGRDAVPLCCR